MLGMPHWSFVVCLCLGKEERGRKIGSIISLLYVVFFVAGFIFGGD